MYWICYIILPAVVAWKKRSANLAQTVFALFSTMLSAYLAVWCEGLVRSSVGSLIPQDKLLLPWMTMGAMVIIWFIVEVIVFKVIEMIQPEGFELFAFPLKAEKYLTPAAVFLHTGLIIALIFTILSVSPVKKYAPFVFDNPSLCSAARYRVLWTSFFIDRFSCQSAGVTDRRRAFDRFVPEDPSKVAQPVPQKRKVK